MISITTWMFDGNLRPFLTSLSWFVAYQFEPDEWAAIECGIESTDQEADCWYNYEFTGEHRALLWLARDPGTSVVHLRIEVPEPVVPKVEAAITIFQTFHIRPDSPLNLHDGKFS